MKFQCRAHILDLVFVREKATRRETKLLNVLLFVKSTLWKTLFGKDYKFEHECIVKKEVKEEVFDQAQATDIIDPSNYKFKSEYIVKKEVKK